MTPKTTKFDLASKRVIDALEVPAKNFKIYLDEATPHLGIRVTEAGGKVWIFERRHEGKTVRRTLGKVDRLSYRDAVRELKITDGELVQGRDAVTANKVERVQIQRALQDRGPTLREALVEYCAGKRRSKDNLPIKARTKDDYLKMLGEPKALKNGSTSAGGELYPLADKRLKEITGTDLRELHAIVLARSQRRADYLLQVFRAVTRWHGVTIEDNPLDVTQAGKNRLIVTPPKSAKNPIPVSVLGAWWNASFNVVSQGAADSIRLQLLCGMRTVEVYGDEFGNSPILVKDCNLDQGTITLFDTKNRKNHTIYMSRQVRDIVQRHAAGKKPTAPLFDTLDTRSTLQAINEAAGLRRTQYTPQDMRSTFASIAAATLSGSMVKVLVNHAGADVTADHYITLDDESLRAGWQTVADFIEAKAKAAKK